MNERKKHLADLAHGKHHPQKHDWIGSDKPSADAKPAPKKPPTGAEEAAEESSESDAQEEIAWQGNS